MRTAHVPFFAFRIRRQNKRALPRSDQYACSTHPRYFLRLNGKTSAKHGAKRLEDESGPNLERSGTIRLGADDSETRTGRLRVGRRERRMVHHVERFQAQLEVGPLREIE